MEGSGSDGLFNGMQEVTAFPGVLANLGEIDIGGVTAGETWNSACVRGSADVMFVSGTKRLPNSGVLRRPPGQILKNNLKHSAEKGRKKSTCSQTVAFHAAASD